MALYGSRYYAYGKPPSRGSQFASGFVRGIADALEQRNQAIMRKREQEFEKQFMEEQRRFQTLMSQVGAVQRDPTAFPPSIGPQLQALGNQFNVPVAIPAIEQLLFQQAEQQGLKQREVKRKAGIEERGIVAREKTAKASMIRARKPTRVDNPYSFPNFWKAAVARAKEFLGSKGSSIEIRPDGTVSLGSGAQRTTPEEFAAAYDAGAAQIAQEWAAEYPVPASWLKSKSIPFAEEKKPTKERILKNLPR